MRTPSGRPRPEPQALPILSEEQHFAGLVAQDPVAWEQLILRFGPLVKTIALRSGLRGSELDDVLQATWTTLLRHAGSITRPESLASWIGTTAAREAWRQRHKRARSEGAGEARHRALGHEAPEVREPSLDLERLERAQAVRDSVQALGERCRALLEALFLAPAPPAYTELAHSLGIPIGSIGPTRARCLAKLEGLLAERGIDTHGI